MWSLSQLQLIEVVVLYLFFSHLSIVFAIKICTAIIKEKGSVKNCSRSHKCLEEGCFL